MITCPQCNYENAEGSRYCSQCGASLSEESPADTKRKRLWLPILTPAIVLVLVGAALYFVYDQQAGINKEVVTWKTEAEEAALAGEYREAEKLLTRAIQERPDEEALQEELSHVQTALSMEKELEEVSKLLEEGSLSEADEQLSTIQAALKQENGRLYQTLVPALNEMDSRFTLQEVNEELSKITDVDELAAKLNTLSDLNLEEAAKVREKIYEKIVNRSTKTAEAAAEEKQYTEAIALIDEGLQYVSNDEKLIQLKERVQQEKQAFEQAAQERLESAMQQAAQDELRNETEALEVADIRMEKDEFGDYKISGELKSVATQVISTISVKYDIKTQDGEVVRSESAKVYPNYLTPGSTGSFEKMYYNLEEGEYMVEMTELEWLVE
ncbi:zinc ribbon domain-containing protein [Halobacillus litoralis]|uniref:zinc ribbon domain-containing protein n=1 Tax=Halobacillus litoralis TaxID=45668 RepID=UPI001CD3256D|nr:zinc ribbon domain-containing protein [Halobacillus litoralis]MCA1023752.1 zinc-ribbon domain-containing protein [Halobacillus litoralis]